MVFCGFMSHLPGTLNKGTCHPTQCSSSDCCGTQLIRHGNDGSMLLASLALFGRAVCLQISPSARDTLVLPRRSLFARNLACFHFSDFVYVLLHLVFEKLVAEEGKWITHTNRLKTQNNKNVTCNT